jgi:hypothetical protein
MRRHVAVQIVTHIFPCGKIRFPSSPSTGLAAPQRMREVKDILIAGRSRKRS